MKLKLTLIALTPVLGVRDSPLDYCALIPLLYSPSSHPGPEDSHEERVFKCHNLLIDFALSLHKPAHDLGWIRELTPVFAALERVSVRLPRELTGELEGAELAAYLGELLVAAPISVYSALFTPNPTDHDVLETLTKAALLARVAEVDEEENYISEICDQLSDSEEPGMSPRWDRVCQNPTAVAVYTELSAGELYLLGYTRFWNSVALDNRGQPDVAGVPFELDPLVFYACVRYRANCDIVKTNAGILRRMVPDLDRKLERLRQVYRLEAFTQAPILAASEYHTPVVGLNWEWEEMGLGLPPFPMMRIFQEAGEIEWPLLRRLLERIETCEDPVALLLEEAEIVSGQEKWQVNRLLDHLSDLCRGRQPPASCAEQMDRLVRVDAHELAATQTPDQFTILAMRILDLTYRTLDEFVEASRLTPDAVDELRERENAEFFRCPICMESYDDVQACGPCEFETTEGQRVPHHMCSDCVRKIAEGTDEFTCPTCKNKVPVHRLE